MREHIQISGRESRVRKERGKERREQRLFGRGGVFRNGLGAFRDGMLGQFTGQDESHAIKRKDKSDGLLLRLWR